ncbi:hypothetical protein [Streptomyces chartreusis]|uniref:hypothetical protein n=1 Tax=Streptomyces chartreusis TaxID=1969 RepID=UPI0036366F88
MRAKAEQPQVLTDPWGGQVGFPEDGPRSRTDRVWAVKILDAVEQGIVVVFAAGARRSASS